MGEPFPELVTLSLLRLASTGGRDWPAPYEDSGGRNVEQGRSSTCTRSSSQQAEDDGASQS